MLDLPAEQLELVRDALRRHLPGRTVIAFGSRANGKARIYSDLDLCVMGEEPPDSRALSNLKDELEDSPLPIRVDVLDWAGTSSPFREIIKAQKQVTVQE